LRELTFNGYLKKYVRFLSIEKTNSIYKLAKEVPHNLRLREPLFLYAYSVGKVDILLKATSNYSTCFRYSELVKQYTYEDLLIALEEMDEQLGWDYLKVYKSYCSRRDKSKTNTDTKVLIHKRIRCLQVEKGISNYRLYTDLNLNPSNTNAFLKHGNVGRFKMETAEKMLDYLEAA